MEEICELSLSQQLEYACRKKIEKNVFWIWRSIWHVTDCNKHCHCHWLPLTATHTATLTLTNSLWAWVTVHNTESAVLLSDCKQVKSPHHTHWSDLSLKLNIIIIIIVMLKYYDYNSWICLDNIWICLGNIWIGHDHIWICLDNIWIHHGNIWICLDNIWICHLIIKCWVGKFELAPELIRI